MIWPRDFEDFASRAASGKVVAVSQTMSADLLTPLLGYLRIARDAPYSFLLESVEGGEQLARYSFLGADPYAVVRGSNAHCTVLENGKSRQEDCTAIDYLRRVFAGHELECAEQNAPMAGGCVGYLAYGAAKWFEPAVKIVAPECDDAVFMIYRTVLAFDHVRQQIQVRTLVFSDEANGSKAKLQSLYEAGVEQNRKIVERLSAAVELPLVDPAAETTTEVPFDSNFARDDFEHAVKAAKELIAAGECYQVVLSQRFHAELRTDPVALYRALRMTNPSPYMFLLRLADEALVGASPEMLVRCRGRELSYRPIAGTRPRGANAAEDAQLAADLLADEKERAEHMMLVDLGRNDLGRVAEYGSVKVEQLLTVEKYSHVQHLVTQLSGRLRPELDRFDALGACFPAGTVTGAPKIRAMQAIAELERGPRDVYSGSVLYADYTGNLDSCIAIRTMEVTQDYVYVQAGAGIVYDSDPGREWEETVNKSRALRRAVSLAQAGVKHAAGH
ncbi:MAG TPA: anthranilate synthase component I family protein [candidate division Zixibacteria bacterium]|nr:anthranilate synthase component I family protein [candidate division Zixibacteria bacterium]